MTLETIYQPTIDEIRNTFSAMIGRLKQDTDEIPDELVGKARLVQLEIFLAHSRSISDPDALLDFCLSALAMMKCSIDGARLGRKDLSLKKTLKGMRDHTPCD